jgi:hypothetical protein
VLIYVTLLLAPVDDTIVRGDVSLLEMSASGMMSMVTSDFKTRLLLGVIFVSIHTLCMCMNARIDYWIELAC